MELLEELETVKIPLPTQEQVQLFHRRSYLGAYLHFHKTEISVDCSFFKWQEIWCESVHVLHI